MANELPKQGPTEPWIQDVDRKDLPAASFQKTETGLRAPITDEEYARMNRELTAVGKLMKDSGVWWQLDGTYNVSLRSIRDGGTYIGVHSDVDVSIMRSDLPKLEEYMKARGYGLFLQSIHGSTRQMRRIGSANYSKRTLDGTAEETYFVAINEHGEIRMDADVVRIEVQVVDLNEFDNPVERELQYPKKWLVGENMTLNGEPIVLSHPARYLLFKIFQTRGYDEDDMVRFVKMRAISEEEIETVERIVLTAAKDDGWWERHPDLKKDVQRLRDRFHMLRTLAAEQ